MILSDSVNINIELIPLFLWSPLCLSSTFSNILTLSNYGMLAKNHNRLQKLVSVATSFFILYLGSWGSGIPYSISSVSPTLLLHMIHLMIPFSDFLCWFSSLFIPDSYLLVLMITYALIFLLLTLDSHLAACWLLVIVFPLSGRWSGYLWLLIGSGYPIFCYSAL